ncbi:MAG: HlyD family efflux transporter periplasmic adaptor subunit [Phycisphaerae bacterium]|nr:HlyD family efflux transporter periplasmic adaptor subunit [Phycisphaerae bacterium]
MRCKAILLPTTLFLLPTLGGEAHPNDLDQTDVRAGTVCRAIDKNRVTVILAPRRKALLSAEVSARVASIHRELGEAFAIDEILIRLHDAVYRTNKQVAGTKLTIAESELARVRKLAGQQTRERHADAVLAAAQANLAATLRLYDDGHASQIDLENAKRDLVVATTERELVESTSAEELNRATRELATASGNLEIAEQQLDHCAITAPWAGRVTRLLINEHELVDRGTPVIEVIDDRVLLAKFLVPSHVFLSVRVGTELNLMIDETAAMVVARVSHIAAALDPASVTFEVHAEVMNADGRLRAGMNGSLSLSEITGS